jgi:NAD-dependent dihydropyrimidine dehydrogenase PreA subunit
LFVHVEIDSIAAANKELAKKLAEVCPVNIFAVSESGTSVIVEENEDECVLCDLCVQAAPLGHVRVIKLYEQ